MSELSNSLTHFYRRSGLLPPLTLVSLIVAIAVHHFSRLPAAYTWLQPLETLRKIFGEPHFPALALAVWLLGWWGRRGDFEPVAVATALAGNIDGKTALRWAVRPAACICLVVLADSVLFDRSRDAIDLIALAVAGLLLAGSRTRLAEGLRLVAYAALSSLIFLCICYSFTVVKSLTFVSGRVFDGSIIALESRLFGFVPHRALALWGAAHPHVVTVCDWAYFHFFDHMALTTVLLAGMRKHAQRTEYLGALALCYLIGGPIYHLIPARGPGFFELRYFHFLERSDLTVSGIRFWLHDNTRAVLQGTAGEVRTWGYIACMPSLHVAQEVVMLYYARASRLALVLAGSFTLVTLFAVVLLGFHYPVDSLAGIALAVVAIAIAHWQRDCLLPPGLAADRDHVPALTRPLFRPFLAAYRQARRAQRGDA